LQTPLQQVLPITQPEPVSSHALPSSPPSSPVVTDELQASWHFDSTHCVTWLKSAAPAASQLLPPLVMHSAYEAQSELCAHASAWLQQVLYVQVEHGSVALP